MDEWGQGISRICKIPRERTVLGRATIKEKLFLAGKNQFLGSQKKKKRAKENGKKEKPPPNDIPVLGDAGSHCDKFITKGKEMLTRSVSLPRSYH